MRRSGGYGGPRGPRRQGTSPNQVVAGFPDVKET